MEIVLILTGCIKPNVIDAGVILDTEIRKKQYIDAIMWYYNNTTYKILFCENSGTDISKHIGLENKQRIEILTYTSDNHNRERSKGYKEMEILEYVYNHSKIISSADILVKITGRLQLLNIKSIINCLQYIIKIQNPKKGWVSAYQNSRKAASECKYIFFHYCPLKIANSSLK